MAQSPTKVSSASVTKELQVVHTKSVAPPSRKNSIGPDKNIMVAMNGFFKKMGFYNITKLKELNQREDSNVVDN